MSVCYDLLLGDSKDVLKDYPENSFDAVVTDPPYGLSFMGKKWDYDVPSVELWAEIYRVLKPGGHVLSFAGSRTYHRMTVNIEDAGFEIRDQIMWLYGTGFPKSTNVAKQIDKRNAKQMSWFGPWFRKWRKAQGMTQKEVAKLFPSKTGKITGCVSNWESGKNLPTNDQYNFLCDHFNLPFETLEEAEREIVASKTRTVTGDGTWAQNTVGGMHAPGTKVVDETKAATDLAKKWEGWGTALKPAHEPIVVARKPFKGPVVENVLSHGTGAINIGDSRISHADPEIMRRNESSPQSEIMHFGPRAGERGAGPNPEGRWPANVMLTHHPECVIKGMKEVGQGKFKQGSYRQAQEDNLYELGMMKKEGALQEAPDNYGVETIQNWECVDNCPVKIMDDQSGILGAGHAPKKSKGNPFSGENDTEREEKHFGSGGASRFFHNTAHEPIVMARKPIGSTIAENVLEHGTGALNIDKSRIPTSDSWDASGKQSAKSTSLAGGADGTLNVSVSSTHPEGRFPANVILSHHAECNEQGCDSDCPIQTIDKQSGITKSVQSQRGVGFNDSEVFGTGDAEFDTIRGFKDSGGASRFFYQANHEPIVMARKPFKGAVAENVLEHGTGALNIDGARIDHGGEKFDDKTAVFTNRKGGDLSKTVISGKAGSTDEENNAMMLAAQAESMRNLREKGRFPANVIHDGSEQITDQLPNDSARFFYEAHHEPIVMARKPFKGPVVENVLEHGTGAINIDDSRIDHNEDISVDRETRTLDEKGDWGFKGVSRGNEGRFPANVIHDGSDVIVGQFPSNNPGCKPHKITAGEDSVEALQSKGWGFGGTDKVAGYEDGDNLSAARFFKEIPPEQRSMWYQHGEGDGTGVPQGPVYNDDGSAARFFYCAKPSRAERDAGLGTLDTRQWDFTRNEDQPSMAGGEGNAYNRGVVKRSNYHPTVKPIKLMRYLCRLVTPPGGIVLDPFVGSGTTGIAAVQEGFNFIGVERDPNYITLATHRIEHWLEEDE